MSWRHLFGSCLLLQLASCTDASQPTCNKSAADSGALDGIARLDGVSDSSYSFGYQQHADSPGQGPQLTWRWENPLPQGNALNALWGHAQDQVFAVGARGTVLQFNGSNWTAMTSGTAAQLSGIWGCQDGSLMAVGAGGTILTHADSAWRAQRSGSSSWLSSVWCAAGNQAFAVGENRTILQYDGSSWSPMSWNEPRGYGKWTASQMIRLPIKLHSVWGRSATDVYAVGEYGTLLHFDGGQWRVFRDPLYLGYTFTDLWDNQGQEIYLLASDPRNAGSNRLLSFSYLKFATKTTYSCFSPNSWLSSIWGSGSSSQLMAVGAQGTFVYASDRCDYAPSDSWLRSVWGQGSDFFAVGDRGTILRYNGGQWTALNSGPTDHLRDIWSDGAGLVLALGEQGALLQRHQGQWQPVPTATQRTLNRLWGSDSHHVYAVGDQGTILQFDGAQWQQMAPASQHQLTAIWGSDPRHIWAVGAGGVIHFYDGQSWQHQDSPVETDLHAVWGASATQVYAVGDGGTLLQFDGQAWKKLPPVGTEALNALWGSDGHNLYAVGSGNIYRFNGQRWTQIVQNFPCNLTAIHGRNAKQIVAASACGSLLLFDGAQWKAYDSPTDHSLQGVWLSGETQGLAVGDSGTILAFEPLKN